MDARTMKPVMTHLAMVVHDLDATVRFYNAYCEMTVIHERGDGAERVVWMAEEGREKDLIFVLMQGAAPPPQQRGDYSHMGFALASRAAVDAIAARARADGCLAWPPRQDDFPVGYLCGVADPSGNVVEFSYGQPLGPGAPDAGQKR